MQHDIAVLPTKVYSLSLLDLEFKLAYWLVWTNRVLWKWCCVSCISLDLRGHWSSCSHFLGSLRPRLPSFGSSGDTEVLVLTYAVVQKPRIVNWRMRGHAEENQDVPAASQHQQLHGRETPSWTLQHLWGHYVTEAERVNTGENSRKTAPVTHHTTVRNYKVLGLAVACYSAIDTWYI